MVHNNYEWFAGSGKKPLNAWKIIMTELDSPKWYLHSISTPTVSILLLKIMLIMDLPWVNNCIQEFSLPFDTFSVGAFSLFLGKRGSPLRRAPRVGGRAWLGGGVGVELWTVWPAPGCGGAPWGRGSTKFTVCPPFTTIWPVNTRSYLINRHKFHVPCCTHEQTYQRWHAVHVVNGNCSSNDPFPACQKSHYSEVHSQIIWLTDGTWFGKIHVVSVQMIRNIQLS